MRSFYALACAVVVVFALVACDSGDAPATGGAAAQPLDGRGVGKASQLIGVWFATTEGEFEVLEFMKDGKALVGDGSSGVMVDYSVLDGGRLSLVLPGGMTTVLDAVIADEQMEISGQSNTLFAGGTQRLRRLKSDETVAQARKSLADERAKAYRERVAALNAFLKQPGLVITYTQPNSPPTIAMEIKSAESGFFTGQAWHDDKPPRLNQINGQLSMNEHTQAAEVILTFGPRIAPPATQADGGGQVSLQVTGDAKNLRIAGNIVYGDGGNFEMVLKADPAMHKQVVGRFQQELARIEALKQPLIALLKDHAVLRGTMQSQDQRQTWPDTAELVLSRDPASGQYYCEGTMVTGMNRRGEVVATAAAQIVIVGDRALLRMVTPPAREYQLTANGKQLTGIWMPPGYNQGHSASFDVVEALDAKARDERFDAQRRALGALSADAVFTGLAHEGSRFGLDMPIPIRLQLTPAGDGGFTAKADYPSMSTLTTLTGRIADTRSGPRLQLMFTGAEATPGDKIFFSSLQNGMWSFAPQESGGSTQLAGYFTGPPLHFTVLTPATDASLAAIRKALGEALAAGGRFHMSRFIGWHQQGQTPCVVEWKLDSAGGSAGDKFAGKVLTNPRLLGGNEQVAPIHQGSIVQENGWVKLKFQQDVPLKAAGDSFIRQYELYAARDAAGVLQLCGAAIDVGRVTNGSRVSAHPLTLHHQAVFVPIAAADAPTQKAIADAIAAVEKATQDATAARMAQEQAAFDARRAKLAPFLPVIRAQTGSVILTDLPAEMSSIILETRLDETNLTISGKGIDLREFPARDFTFDGGLDNYGQLTLTTSLSKTPLAFNAASDSGATGRGVKLNVLSGADRAKLDALIASAQRLQTAAPQTLTVQTLDAAAAKAREANLAAVTMPGVAIFRGRRSDQVGAMFTAEANGRYRWAKEPVLLRLNEPMTGSALYIKGGGPTDNLTVIINGVHRTKIPAIAQLGGAIVTLPPGLQILDLRLEAEGTAQARGVVLVK